MPRMDAETTNASHLRPTAIRAHARWHLEPVRKCSRRYRDGFNALVSGAGRVIGMGQICRAKFARHAAPSRFR